MSSNRAYCVWQMKSINIRTGEILFSALPACFPLRSQIEVTEVQKADAVENY